MLDHVEGVGGVEPGRDLGRHVVNRRLEAAPSQPPAQVGRAGVVEVGEFDPVAGLEQHQAVGADPAAVVEQPGPGSHGAPKRLEIGHLGPGHGERREVVQIGERGSVELLLVLAGGELRLELFLVAPQPLELEALTEILGQLVCSRSGSSRRSTLAATRRAYLSSRCC